jgi:DNA polymerase-3 subunit beta
VTRFSFTQATRPAVLTGVDDDGSPDDDYKYLLMPVRLTG